MKLPSALQAPRMCYPATNHQFIYDGVPLNSESDIAVTMPRSAAAEDSHSKTIRALSLVTRHLK